MKKQSIICALLIAVFLLTVSVCAADTRPIPKIVEISDVHNNELFEIIEEVPLESTGGKMDVYNASYAFWSLESGKVSDSLPVNWQTLPNFFPDDKTYNDGLRLSSIGYRQCFLDADGNEIAFPKTSGYHAEMKTYMNFEEYGYFREKQYYNCGYIHLAKGMSKDFAYTALYNVSDNVFYYFPTVYTLREDTGPYTKYHISGFDSDGYSTLYLTRVWPGQNSYIDDVCYKIRLKQFPVVTVKYNGEKIAFDRVPVIDGGRTLVPLRAIFEKIGAEVVWDGTTKTVTASKGDITVSLTIDSTTAVKNGESVTLDVPGKIIGGRTMVPVRFISDCFGVKVGWDSMARCVSLTQE